MAAIEKECGPDIEFGAYIHVHVTFFHCFDILLVRVVYKDPTHIIPPELFDGLPAWFDSNASLHTESPELMVRDADLEWTVSLTCHIS